MSHSMYDDIERILITQDQIAQRVKEVAEKIDCDYAAKTPIIVSILKGSVMFFADLTRLLKIDINMDFMVVSSYGNSTCSSGNVQIVKDLSQSIEGRDVIIVDDIVDTGHTLACLKELLLKRNPSSIKICALLDKKSRREVNLSPDYYCFDVANEFVVGYGLDYAEKYRNLPEIGVLKEEIYHE